MKPGTQIIIGSKHAYEHGYHLYVGGPATIARPYLTIVPPQYTDNPMFHHVVINRPLLFKYPIELFIHKEDCLPADNERLTHLLEEEQDI